MSEEGVTIDLQGDEKIDMVLNRCSIVPVIVEDNLKRARQVAEILVEAGITTLEVTLRTPNAIDVIREMSLVEGSLVGAGTVLNPGQLEECMEAGAQFIVSPGITVAMVEAARRNGVPYLPAIATPSEVMMGKDLGLRRFKVFPCGNFGGVSLIKTYSAVFGDMRWMPSGGIRLDNYKEYLALPSVAAVGTSWLTSGNPDLEEVNKRAHALGLSSKHKKKSEEKEEVKVESA